MSAQVSVAAWTAARGPRAAIGLSAVAGALAALGQAPFDLWFLSVPGFAAYLLIVAQAATARRAVWRALAGGAAYFAVALHWIVEPFLVDAARYGWMAPFALLFMATGLALFWAVPGWVMARLWPQRATARRVFALAALVALAEYARANVLTGFPWAHPGHVLIDTPYLALSAYVGPHGLTALVLALAATLAVALSRGGALVATAVALPFAVVALVADLPAAPAPGEDAARVRLVQPNASQRLKWRADMIPVFFNRALDLTAQPPADGGAPPDLVVWPETSMAALLEDSAEWRAAISDAAGAAGVIVGTQRFEGTSPRNVAALLDEDGRVRQVYDKHHLVPFGEYMPGGRLARRLGIRGLAETLGGGYSPGPGPSIFDLGPGLGRAFPMICYEAIFPQHVMEVDRPDWMVQLTNDAWFGEFSGPYQHLAIARLRAAEQGIPLLRAANTGVSAVIDARGRITASIPLGRAGAIDAALPPALPPTYYARTGDRPVLVFLLATLGLLVAFRRKNGH